MCVIIDNCNPKRRRKIIRRCQKESLEHNGRVKSNKCSRTAADLTQPKVHLSPSQSYQMFSKYTTNININKSLFPFTLFFHTSRLLAWLFLLHLSLWHKVSYCDLSNLSHKVQNQPKITAWQAKYKIKHPVWSSSRYAFLYLFRNGNLIHPWDIVLRITSCSLPGKHLWGHKGSWAVSWVAAVHACCQNIIFH